MNEKSRNEIEPLIKIEENYIYFELATADKPEQQDNLQSIITIYNLCECEIGLRTRTTKKDLYTVFPTYTKIYPGGITNIKITYFMRDLNEDLSKHKFRFESFKINHDNSNTDIRELFKNIDNNKESKNSIFSISKSVLLKIGKSREIEFIPYQNNNIHIPLILPNQTKPNQINERDFDLQTRSNFKQEYINILSK